MSETLSERAERLAEQYSHVGLRDDAEVATTLRALAAENATLSAQRDLLAEIVARAVRELGCENDYGAIMDAIAALRRERDGMYTDKERENDRVEDDAVEPWAPLHPALTVEQRAWQIVHEHGSAWCNAYSRDHPNSRASESSKRNDMAHRCVVAALSSCLTSADLTAENATLLAERDAALARVRRLEGALVSIEEYWRGSRRWRG